MTRSNRDVVWIDGVRTPFAKADTKLKNVHPAELGRVALKELLARTNIDVNAIDDVIIGNIGGPPDAVNIARVVALNAGIPQRVPASTVHRNCASALESISGGFDKIRSGMADAIVAGGTENMSQSPMLMSRAFTDIIGKLASAKTTSQRLGALGALLKADFQQVLELATTAPMAKTP
ncbi:MAG: acetyl-CoA C-acyltransferase, partial [Bdellovibrionaceae bacterium]|nr:acetyl-CoA C-acyltransferase [Pseudobdellovibrionaceae bacterium]